MWKPLVESWQDTRGNADDIEILVDGNEQTASDLNPSDVHELRVSGTGPRTEYTVGGTDIVYSTATNEAADRVGIDRIEGIVRSQDDTYLFQGEVTSFRVADGSVSDIDVFIDGQQQSLDTLNPSQSEVRTLTVDDPWQTYDLAGDYQAPVVIANPPSYNGDQPCHVRLRNVSSQSFDARTEEWLYMNDVHYDETVGSLAMETGKHELDDGRSASAGRTTVDTDWQSVSFEQPFETTPIVLCQTETEQGWHPIVTRVSNVSPDGFDVRIQEEEAHGTHYTEALGYIALEPGTGTLDGKAFEAGHTTLDHAWDRLSFDREYSNPAFLAGIQSFAGYNTCNLRRWNLSKTGVEVMVEEERSSDEKQTHVNERVAYLVLEERLESFGGEIDGKPHESDWAL